MAGPAFARSGGPPRPAPRSAAAGGIELRLLDIPVNAANDPRTLAYIVDHVAPATVIQRRIEISNTTAAVAHVVLYAAAATIAKGSFLGADGHTANDLATWTSVGPDPSDVPSGGRVTATVTITVPSGASPGERYGMVWAEAPSAPVVGGVVPQPSRVGIRLYISIGPGRPPAANFAIDSTTAERSLDGTPMVVAIVRNTGGRALDMSESLQLSAGPGGLSAGPFPATRGITLGIGDSEPVTMVADRRLPAGPWDARITVHGGLLDRSARATITFPHTGGSPSVNTTSPRHGLPYAAIAGFVVLLLGFAAVLVVRSTRSNRSAEIAPLVDQEGTRAVSEVVEGVGKRGPTAG
jgi:hypothetical protein